MNLQEARATFAAHRPSLEAQGISWEYGAEPQGYMPDEWRRNPLLALDALPTLATAPNSAMPQIFTTFVDPEIYRVVFAPSRFAEMFSEERHGDWVTDTILFPIVESTGEVSSYGDFNENGRSGVNPNWPARQHYRFQTMKEYGDLENQRMAAARINYVSEIDKASALNMTKFLNFSYGFGIAGLQTYGILNDPNLGASLTPSLKVAGGTAWIQGGVVVATANEIYNDILTIYTQLATQNQGLVNMQMKMMLALGPGVEPALGATNSFGVNVRELLKMNFPNMRVEVAPQYGVVSATNTQGIAAGNLVQMVVDEVEGQRTAFVAFTEKMRAYPVVVRTSSWRQKVGAGTGGAVLRYPPGIASMVGV